MLLSFLSVSGIPHPISVTSRHRVIELQKRTEITEKDRNFWIPFIIRFCFRFLEMDTSLKIRRKSVSESLSWLFLLFLLRLRFPLRDIAHLGTETDANLGDGAAVEGVFVGIAALIDLGEGGIG